MAEGLITVQLTRAQLLAVGAAATFMDATVGINEPDGLVYAERIQAMAKILLLESGLSVEGLGTLGIVLIDTARKAVM